MEQQELTVEEIIKKTIDILNDIPVPLKHHNLITVPIQNAIHNLTMCIRAWEEAEIKEAEQAEKEEQKEGEETNE